MLFCFTVAKLKYKMSLNVETSFIFLIVFYLSNSKSAAMPHDINTLQEHITVVPSQPPVIVQAPTNLTVKEGDTATFSCLVSSYYMRNINDELEPQHCFDSSLEVSSAGDDPSQLYVCCIRYELGHVAYSSALLTVTSDNVLPLTKALFSTETNNADKFKDHNNEKQESSYDTGIESKPEFVMRTMKREVGNLRLECQAKGNPTPTITWTKDGKEIVGQVDKGHYYDYWTINIKYMSADDSGNFTCKVCNRLGCVEHTFRDKFVDHNLNHGPGERKQSLDQDLINDFNQRYEVPLEKIKKMKLMVDKIKDNKIEIFENTIEEEGKKIEMLGDEMEPKVKDNKIAEFEEQNEGKDNKIAEFEEQIEAKDNKIEDLEKQIEVKGNKTVEFEEQIEAKGNRMQELEEQSQTKGTSNIQIEEFEKQI
ncbi:hypothetical protein WDU94_011267, partial [Cyamophila willieti]